MWAEKSVFYQIYPLRFCEGAEENPPILKLIGWIDHIKALGADGVYFNPIFQSGTHGYDTEDYLKIDRRLGDDKAFQNVTAAFHEKGIKIVLDGVFNHVGRGFWAFLDVKEKKWDSKYRDFFHIDFGGNSCYDDGFWYEGWEGHFELVKLNLQNAEVRRYLIDCVKEWIDRYDIDGLRLDVAYLLNAEFLKELSRACKEKKSDFFLTGEMLHGDYNRIVQNEMLDSCTNYECYKGLYSSFNSKNMFEIAHSLTRQFGKDPWALYKGKHLCNFADNHDVTRIASMLNDKRDLYPLYALLFAMPGIPFLYYGSEWGEEGVKTAGSDDNLRPSFYKPTFNDLAKHIAQLSKLRAQEKAFIYGDFECEELSNLQFVFSRSFEGEKITTAINIAQEPYFVKKNYGELLLPSAPSESVASHSFAIWKNKM